MVSKSVLYIDTYRKVYRRVAQFSSFERLMTVEDDETISMVVAIEVNVTLAGQA